MTQFDIPDKKIELIRFWSDENQSQGVLIVRDMAKDGQVIYMRPCIERGDRDNQRNVSRIPQGTYDIIQEWSDRFGAYLWELKDVPGRSECKIHSANFWHQLNGCISPGLKISDINQDGYMDITDSKKALADFHKALKEEFKLKIQVIDLD